MFKEPAKFTVALVPVIAICLNFIQHALPNSICLVDVDLVAVTLVVPVLGITASIVTKWVITLGGLPYFGSK